MLVGDADEQEHWDAGGQGHCWTGMLLVRDASGQGHL